MEHPPPRRTTDKYQDKLDVDYDQKHEDNVHPEGQGQQGKYNNRYWQQYIPGTDSKIKMRRKENIASVCLYHVNITHKEVLVSHTSHLPNVF